QTLAIASGTVVPLCPADTTSVAAGSAAFLRPEAAGPTPSLPGCPAGTAVTAGVDLNGDGDADDEVVHFAPNGGTIQNLARAATAVSLSASCAGGTNAGQGCDLDTDCPGSASCTPSWLAALVSEAGQGNTDLNGDGDTNDTVVEVHPAGSGGWTKVPPPPPFAPPFVGQAADVTQVSGSLVAFITPECAWGGSVTTGCPAGGTDLNGDGDAGDRVLQLYDAAAATLIPVVDAMGHRQAAEELVLGR